jgi:hypothetical protein
MITTLFAQKEHDLGDKKVIGKDKRKFSEDANIIKKTNNKNLIDKDNEVKIMEQTLNIGELPGIELPELPDTGDGLTSGQENERGLENKMIFGLGGFKKIDSFRYLVDYTKDDKENDFAYYLHIDRNIRGRDRQNSELDMDNYSGKIWYGGLFLGLAHHIKDENLPGKGDAQFQVNTSKEDIYSELNFSLDIISTKKHKWKIVSDIYSRELMSLTSPERQFVNNLYKAYTAYDNFFKIGTFNSLLQFHLGFFRDNNMIDDKTSSYNFHVMTKMKQQSSTAYEIDMKLGTEYMIKNSVTKKLNYSGLLQVSKKMNQKFSLGLGVEKENLYKLNKDHYSDFLYDTDILPIMDLKKDDNFKASLLMNLNVWDIFLESKISHHMSRDKIIYMEDDFLNDEIMIKITNSMKKLNWQQIELKASTAFYVFRGEVKYIFSTLNDVSFHPQHTGIMNLIFKYKIMENRLTGRYYSRMYGDLDLDQNLPEYKNIDLNNDFQISDNLTISINAFNLFNFKGERKTKYPVDQRKIMLEFKIIY